MRRGTHSEAQTRKKSRRASLLQKLSRAAIVLLAGSATAAAFALASPVPAQKPEQISSSVWVKNEAAGLYGRVNLAAKELQTKQSVEKASAFSSGQILNAGSQGFILAGAQVYSIDSAAPQSIEAGAQGASSQAANTPGAAARVWQNGDWAALLDSTGVVWRSLKADLGAPDRATLASSPEKTALAANIEESGRAEILYENGEVWEQPVQGPPEKLSGQINEPLKNLDPSGFFITRSATAWAVSWQGADSAENRLWANGQLSPEGTPAPTPAAKFTAPSSGESIYFETPRGLFEINASGRVAELRAFETDLTPSAIALSPKKDPAAENIFAKLGLTGKKSGDEIGETSDLEAIWESDSEVISSTNLGSRETITESKRAGQASGPRKTQLFNARGLSILSAAATGEVWIRAPGSQSWEAIKSTLNNWQTEMDRAQAQTNIRTPDKNFCPSPPEMNEFGVRPGKDNLIPALLPVSDPNRGDVLTIVGGVRQSNEELGQFRVVNNGQALAVNVPRASSPNAPPRQTQISIFVSDGGADEAGACRTEVVYTILEHPFSGSFAKMNSPPQKIGAEIPSEHLNSAPYPATAAADALAGWYDPDGDEIFPVQRSAPDRGRAVVSAGGQIVFQPENIPAGESQAVNYLVEDSLGAASPASVWFKTLGAPEISLDSIIRSAPAGQAQKIEMSPYVHGAAASWVLSLLSVPDGISAAVSPNGQQISLQASKPGEYAVSYTAGAAAKSGTIHFLALEEEALSAQISASPMVAYLRSNEDTTLDVTSALQNPSNLPWRITAAKAEPERDLASAPAALIEAGIVSPSEIRLAGSFLTPPAADFLAAGRVSLKIEAGGEEIEAFVALILANPPEDFAPIALPIQVAARPGETVDIPALSSVATSAGAAALIDPRYINETDTAAQGFAFPAGDKIRFLAPSTAKPGEILQRDFWVYTRGHLQTGRAQGRISVLIADPATPVEGSYSGQKSPEEDAKNLQNSGQEDSEIQQPVGFWNILFGAAGEQIRANPLENDAIPEGQKAQVSKAALLAPAGSALGNSAAGNEGATLETEGSGLSGKEGVLRAVSDPEQLKNMSFLAGETGDTTIWEITVDTYSAGVLSKYGAAGSKVTTFTERVILKVSSEESLPDWPQFKDTKVKTNEIFRRQTYSTSVGSALAFPQPATDFAFDVRAGAATAQGAQISGGMERVSQVVLFEAKLRGTDLRAFGFLRVPSLERVMPARANLAVKEVQAGGDPLRIDLPSEISPLDGSALEILEETQSARKRPQASCEIRGNDLVYTPGRLQGEQVDTRTADTCGVFVQWEGEPQTRALISFQIQIVPEKTEPEIKTGAQLEPLAPKESAAVSLRDYITWWGHSDDEISRLQISCETDQQIEARCAGTQLLLAIPREASELADHTISLQIQGHPSTPAVWGLRTKAAPKRADIEVPALAQRLQILEGQEPPSVSVLEAVRSWLDRPEFFTFLPGGTISCAPKQDAKVLCQETGFGVLKFAAAPEATDTGFMAVGRYVFTDRPAENNPNRGSGSVNIDYLALPKQPPPPEINAALARQGKLEIAVSQGSASVPPAQEICLIVDSAPLCKPAGTAGAQKWTADELSSLSKWQQHSFRSLVKNAVGVSPASEEVFGTPFEAIKAPSVKWKPVVAGGEGAVELLISGADAQTEYFAISGATSLEIPRAGETTSCLISAAAMGALELKTLTVEALSRPVTSGKEVFIAARSPAVSVEAILPKLAAFPGSLVAKTIPAADPTAPDPAQSALEFEFAGSLPAAKGVSFEFKWTGICREDTDFLPVLAAGIPPAQCSRAALEATSAAEIPARLAIRAVFDKSAFPGEIDASFTGDGRLFEPASKEISAPNPAKIPTPPAPENAQTVSQRDSTLPQTVSHGDSTLPQTVSHGDSAGDPAKKEREKK